MMESYKEMENMTRETMENIMDDWFGKYPVLLDYLGAAGFYEWPAAKSHHGAEWGGLFKHSLQVTYELKRLTCDLGLTWQRAQSPEIVGMLHDVCKLDDYCILPFGLIMLMGLINLTDEEAMCIRYHMGAFTDQKEWEYYTRAVKKYPNVLYTHTADMIASQIKGI